MTHIDTAILLIFETMQSLMIYNCLPLQYFGSLEQEHVSGFRGLHHDYLLCRQLRRVEESRVHFLQYCRPMILCMRYH